MNDRPRFLATLLDELADQLSLSAGLDQKYIWSRYEHEGLSFLTITLPSFCDGIERALERGSATPDDFPAFARKKNGCLPKFLSGFTSRMFTPCGVLMEHFDPDVLFAVRQITRFMKKAEVPCTKQRTEAAFHKYVLTDMELKDVNEKFRNGHEDSTLRAVADILVGSLFSDISQQGLRCRHGPGATAERLSSSERSLIRYWPIRAEPWFPSSYHAVPNAGHWKRLRELSLLSEAAEPPVRVVAVPKTLKTPRIIAVEPSHMMYMQQSMMQYMVDRIQTHPLTRGSIRFSDQVHNMRSAQVESLKKNRATIDLSEASDRVSLELVKYIFGGEQIYNYLYACRTSKALLPDGTTLTLEKFCSMGSATCFPIESFVFYCLILAAMHDARSIRPTSQSIRMFSRLVDVYGDDLIVPVQLLSFVIDKLESYGLQVNRGKSFSASYFRESCGGDYYKGYPVKPVYLRVHPTAIDDAFDPNVLASLVQTSNQFYSQGLWKTCFEVRSFVDKKLREVVKPRRLRKGISAYPRIAYRRNFNIDEDSLVSDRGCFFYSVMHDSYDRWNSKLHRFESFTVTVSPVKEKDSNSPWFEMVTEPREALCPPEKRVNYYTPDQQYIACLFKSMSNIGNDNSVDWESSGRPRNLRLRTGWVW
ncbi:RNA-directed RNA polymerase [ssRNA phage SRR6253161_3]|uniref:RNA-directed RNA polymerase n=1 Tax=ssRNA phage SRR6253161_3 TaxID=2786490 RepID=A0A8S5L4B3_9VIRU|nr:RNA-directed RNA polymerase [ssRNA phage SRR6253161_3]DAD52536.1 TPA_asm: RNA-directed RNA polymerase [ssRNA phage SRR6253161_3]